MVGFGTFSEIEFVRLVTINSGNSKEDILDFFAVLENFADNNLVSQELGVLNEKS
jgi:sulfinoalanine decarboxylase/sulfinoalanine decarboxylase/aspartate 1-decarboxylase